MTKDELIQEINACSSFHVVCHDGNMINIIAESKDTFMKFPDDVEYLKDILVNWRALQTTKNRLLSNVCALLDLINDYVNTPIERRNWVGASEYAFGQLRKNLQDMSHETEQALNGCHMDPSAGPTYELPQHGVIITLDNGQELHSERQYSTFMSSDFQNKAIDFGNFIIPTAIIRSIQKCGDGNDD